MAEREITLEEQATVTALVGRARAAMEQAASLDQAAVDRLCRAIAWAGGNEATARRLAWPPAQKIAWRAVTSAPSRRTAPLQ